MDKEEHNFKDKNSSKDWVLPIVVGVIVLTGIFIFVLIISSDSNDSQNLDMIDNPSINNPSHSNNLPQIDYSQKDYCGDNKCQSTESCSSCPSDCGKCKSSFGDSCYSDDDCENNYCVHSICRISSSYCGDNYCDYSESCSLCSSDCGKCKSSIGGSCYSSSDCISDYCVHNICRSSSTYCGDNFCDSAESCSSCSTDCGKCKVHDVRITGFICDEPKGLASRLWLDCSMNCAGMITNYGDYVEDSYDVEVTVLNPDGNSYCARITQDNGPEVLGIGSTFHFYMIFDEVACNCLRDGSITKEIILK